ncbi:hypothetical protein [Coraliomargarita akajimensis]|uniref:Uncharacterized protein n=1 Tax=Coraliomargarita akajimensis (strain DSM 45221 / IAM 15411 / JCM 23193 / KCTC 12865 / 04OKA010-24) TaxID=583355 RepID=D5EL91_CORAD|nr:hypothetical protein [Coraliomargarita akajimensis]ADE55027.1 hypothetical protein Caka_2009 [Coraliomargarita akajimensis DSM 45221]
MSLSFEDLANSGLPPAHEPSPSVRSHRRLYWTLLIAPLLAYLAWTFWLGPGAVKDSAKLLLADEQSAPSGHVPHTLDNSTEFEASLAYLDDTADTPSYRETPEAASTVKVVEIVSDKGITGTITTVAAPTMEETDKSTLISAEAIEPVVTADERQWTGQILIPDAVKLSRAFISKVRLSRIEVHPNSNGTVRIWIRLQNLTETPLQTKVGCDFRTQRDNSRIRNMNVVDLPAGATIDTHFYSERDAVYAYTVLVKEI